MANYLQKFDYGHVSVNEQQDRPLDLWKHTWLVVAVVAVQRLLVLLLLTWMHLHIYTHSGRVVEWRLREAVVDVVIVSDVVVAWQTYEVEVEVRYSKW